MPKVPQYREEYWTEFMAEGEARLIEALRAYIPYESVRPFTYFYKLLVFYGSSYWKRRGSLYGQRNLGTLPFSALSEADQDSEAFLTDSQYSDEQMELQIDKQILVKAVKDSVQLYVQSIKENASTQVIFAREFGKLCDEYPLQVADRPKMGLGVTNANDFMRILRIRVDRARKKEHLPPLSKQHFSNLMRGLRIQLKKRMCKQFPEYVSE